MHASQDYGLKITTQYEADRVYSFLMEIEGRVPNIEEDQYSGSFKYSTKEKRCLSPVATGIHKPLLEMGQSDLFSDIPKTHKILPDSVIFVSTLE